MLPLFVGNQLDITNKMRVQWHSGLSHTLGLSRIVYGLKFWQPFFPFSSLLIQLVDPDGSPGS